MTEERLLKEIAYYRDRVLAMSLARTPRERAALTQARHGLRRRLRMLQAKRETGQVARWREFKLLPEDELLPEDD